MNNDARLKTLILSVVFSSFGPIVTFIAMMMNSSSTQIADFIRRTVELSVLVLALYLYLRIHKKEISNHTVTMFKVSMYRLLAIVLLISSLVLVYLFILALINPSMPEGSVWLGLSIAILGLLFNGYFMIRYKKFNHQKESFVMDSQSKMYQAKTLLDLNVVIALSAIVIFKESNLSYWIDTLGTLIIAIYLLLRAYSIFRKVL